MDEIIIQNVRCFHTKQITPLAPLTFLVGENSTGKSTFLAATKIAWEIAFLENVPDFNEDPFLMGSYDQIANLRGGRAGSANTFNIGLNILLDEKLGKLTKTNKAEIICTFKRGTAQPQIESWEFNCDPYRVVIIFQESLSNYTLTVITPSGQITFLKPAKIFMGGRSPLTVLEHMDFLRYVTRTNKTLEEFDVKMTSKPSNANLDAISQLISYIRKKMPRHPYAFAPIRTTPKRTYDIMKETPTSVGDHIPAVLAKTFSGKDQSAIKLKESIIKYGQLSGLFEDIDIKRLGNKESDPFQIKVKISGPAFNLVDVGYGVSQVLPIIVDSLTEDKGKLFLLQQPEVHLHPRAQAGLGTFLLGLAKTHNKKFIIETHSDYLLNRVRMDVRDNKSINPAMVSILFFERINSEVFIRPISIDKEGNLVNAPSTFRQFFLEEERRFLGI